MADTSTLTVAIAVNVACIAVIAANGLFVMYRWTPKLLSPYLQLACVGTLLFAAGSLANHLTHSSSTLYWLALILLYTGLLMTVCCWWLVAILVAQHQGSPLPLPRWVWHHVPIICLLLAWAACMTNPWHGLFLTPVPGTRSIYGPLWYMSAALCWFLISCTVVHCLYRAGRAQYADDRWQMLICAMAMATPTLLNLLYVTNSTPLPFDPTIIGFALSTSLFVAAVYRGQIYGATGVRLEDAIENDSRPGFLLDRNQRMIHANKAAKAMFQLPDVRCPVAPLICEHLTDRNGDAVKEDLLLKEHELFRLREDSDYWLSIEHRPVKIGQKDVGAAWFVRDESARVRVDEALQAARKFESLGLIAGGIAHDFNNLLVSVIGNAELAQLKIRQDPDGAEELISRVQQAGQRGADLAKQLLAYAGKASVELSDTDVNATIQELVKMLRSSMRSEVAITLKLDEKATPAIADSSQLTQVLLNLIVNAEEALPAHGGTVTISTQTLPLEHSGFARMSFAENCQPGSFVAVSVADDGPGMDDNTLRQMFDPFFSTKSVGRGLGLAASLGTVRSHSGALDVKTRTGQGTSITVYLPAAGHVSQSTEAVDLNLLVQPGHKALLVDDDNAVRHVHRLMLEQLGFSVSEASSAQDVVEQPVEADVVIADQTMPGMSGISLAEHLTQWYPDLPVVLVSGYSGDCIENDHSIRHFLSKPFTSEQLAGVMARLFPPTGVPAQGEKTA